MDLTTRKIVHTTLYIYTRLNLLENNKKKKCTKLALFFSKPEKNNNNKNMSKWKRKMKSKLQK